MQVVTMLNDLYFMFDANIAKFNVYKVPQFRLSNAVDYFNLNRIHALQRESVNYYSVARNFVKQIDQSIFKIGCVAKQFHQAVELSRNRVKR